MIGLAKIIAGHVTWTRLHKIQKLKFVKAMYVWLFVVPMFSRAFEKVNDVATITVFDYTFDLQLTLPFTWQLFYFSAIFFVLGNLCFYMYCSRLIQDHDNYSDFEGSGKNLQHLYDYTYELNVNWDKFIEENNIKGMELDKAYRKTYWLLHRKANKHNTTARFFTGILYSLAIIMIVYVLLENTHVVVKTMLNL